MIVETNSEKETWELGRRLEMCIRDRMMLVLLAVAPLNLLKGILISVPTMVLYKRISKALHNSAQEQYVPERHSQTEG